MCTMSFKTLIFTILFSLSVALPTSIKATGEWAGCSGQAGVCIDVNTYDCSSSTLTGKCPGDSNIRCCPYPAGLISSECTASSGVCTRSENCEGTTSTGKCPGPSEITCCSSSSECTLGTAAGCETSVLSGLTKQLVDELNAMGISFANFSDTSKILCSGSCEPFLQTAARDALSEATSAANSFLTLNSAYRSSAQQYFIYIRFLRRECNFKRAARPGTSNHEGGLAIDTSLYNEWRPRLEPFGWKWFGNSDPFHFDYTEGGNRDVRRESLRAFQNLWNRNNPNDQIAADGLYGPTTSDRLSLAPCNGW